MNEAKRGNAMAQEFGVGVSATCLFDHLRVGGQKTLLFLRPGKIGVV